MEKMQSIVGEDHRRRNGVGAALFVGAQRSIGRVHSALVDDRSAQDDDVADQRVPKLDLVGANGDERGPFGGCEIGEGQPEVGEHRVEIDRFAGTTRRDGEQGGHGRMGARRRPVPRPCAASVATCRALEVLVHDRPSRARGSQVPARPMPPVVTASGCRAAAHEPLRHDSPAGRGQRNGELGIPRARRRRAPQRFGLSERERPGPHERAVMQAVRLILRLRRAGRAARRPSRRGSSAASGGRGGRRR